MNRNNQQAALAVQRVLREFKGGEGHLSGFYKNFYGGKYVRQFEDAFASYIGTKHAIAVSSGTAALHTAIEALREPHELGFSGLVTAYSFVASASTIVMAGGFPQFCDVDQSLTMNVDEIDTPPRMIVAVHLLGQPCDLDKIHKKFPYVPIVEDCAQSLGAKYKNRMTGSIGDISTFSFQETKSMTTLGEGGMITTDSDRLAERCAIIRNHGEKYKQANRLCYNYRMTEPAAAYGLEELTHYPEVLATQKYCAEIVRKRLPRQLRPVNKLPDTDPSYFLVGSLTAPGMEPEHAQQLRDIIVATINKALEIKSPKPGMTVGPGYSELIPDLPFFRRFKQTDFPVAREMLKQAVWLDIHRFTSPDVVETRMDKINEALA